jgi:hypothetical protein
MARRINNTGTRKFRMQAEYENPERKLGIIAAKANDNLSKILRGERELVPYYQAAGEALLEANEIVGHGNFLKWRRENFDGSDDMAERCQLIARNKATVDSMLKANPKASVNETVRRCKDRELPEPRASRASKTVVIMTAAEEARRKLRKLFDTHVINRLNDE